MSQALGIQGGCNGGRDHGPQKNKRAAHMCQFIPQQPHRTVIKLYVLEDTVHPFVMDVYLHAVKKVK